MARHAMVTKVRGSFNEFDGTAHRVGLEGKTTINRKDWGVSWNAALEAGGVLVGEKVTLEFEISAIKTV